MYGTVNTTDVRSTDLWGISTHVPDPHNLDPILFCLSALNFPDHFCFRIAYFATVKFKQIFKFKKKTM